MSITSQRQHLTYILSQSDCTILSIQVLLQSCKMQVNVSQEIWKSPSLSELTPMLFNTGLAHLGSEASIFKEH